MQESTENPLNRALLTGTIAGLGVAAAASIAGKRESGSYAAPLNATSHILWGDEAGHEDEASLKYTVTGFLLNHASAIFWAAFYEKWFGGRSADSNDPPSLLKPALGAAAVTAGAYITDYYLVPKRLTPGFEKRVSGKSMAMIYAALGAGFVAGDLLRTRLQRWRNNPTT